MKYFVRQIDVSRFCGSVSITTYPKCISSLCARGKSLTKDILLANIKMITIVKHIEFYCIMSGSGKVDCDFNMGQLYSKH